MTRIIIIIIIIIIIGVYLQQAQMGLEETGCESETLNELAQYTRCRSRKL
jgi:hypothetical protein